jgi:succinate dehydrogenase / fumarate reductase, cytochrome b subunit
MLYAGLVMLFFVIFHLAHFTLGYVKPISAVNAKTGAVESVNYLAVLDKEGMHDVYSIMVDGFKNPLISILYLIALGSLYLHLSHGISSLFQTLGLNSPKTQGTLKAAGVGLSLLIVLGYASVVVAIWAGGIPAVKTFVLD